MSFALRRGGRQLRTFALVGCFALAAAGSASAHARISPPVSIANALQLFSLAVPTEQAGTTTTRVVMTTPPGFSITSFVPSPGWHRTVEESVSPSGAVTQRVTWSGGRVPPGEDALFQFLGEGSGSGTYAFAVEQTYANGSIVDWSGPPASAEPAPSIELRSTLGGGGTPLLTIIALAVGASGVLLGGLALLAGAGKRPLA